MRNLVLAAGLTLLVGQPALALQPAPGPVTGGGDQPLMVKTVEPDLSTDPAAIDDLRHRMQKDRKDNRKSGRSEAARPAQLTEILAGKTVHDTAGLVIAEVVKVDSDGAVLRSGVTLVKVPLEGFGVNKKGLLLNLTKPQFDELVASSGAPAPRS